MNYHTNDDIDVLMESFRIFVSDNTILMKKKPVAEGEWSFDVPEYDQMWVNQFKPNAIAGLIEYYTAGVIGIGGPIAISLDNDIIRDAIRFCYENESIKAHISAVLDAYISYILSEYARIGDKLIHQKLSYFHRTQYISNMNMKHFRDFLKEYRCQRLKEMRESKDD